MLYPGITQQGIFDLFKTGLCCTPPTSIHVAGAACDFSVANEVFLYLVHNSWLYFPQPAGYAPPPGAVGEDGEVKGFDFSEQSIRRSFIRKVSFLHFQITCRMVH